jgi:hypothetical protein
MTTPQGQQVSKAQERKRLLIKRWTIFIIGTIFFIAASVTWLLSLERITPYDWSYPLSAIFGVCGSILTLWALLFPLPSIEARQQADTDATSPMPVNAVTNTPNSQSNPSEHTLPTHSIISQHDEKASASGQKAKKTGVHLPDPIFHFSEPLTASKEFFGRARERTTLFSRLQNKASTSIIGKRRIGKTWLLTYIKLEAPTRFGSHCQVGYLDASLPICRTVAGFTVKALEALGITTLSPHSTEIGIDALEQAVDSLIARNQMPVLCIDEFEQLGERQEFDLDFFTGLRAMTQAGLVLITASKCALIEIVSEHVKTSPFFNVFEQLELKPFTKEEEQAFVQAKSVQAGFTQQEQQRLSEYGREYNKKGEPQWFPICLQLTGKMLLEDKWLATIEGASYYRPEDAGYWREFEERWDRAYQGVRG